MKKIFRIAALIAGITMLVASCAKQELDTNQVPVTSDVTLTSYGPRPVVRGGVLRFVGANLDQVASVTIPGCEPITEIEVVRAGVPSEIHVTVPKDGAEVGNVILTTKGGKTIETSTPLSYIETIVLDKVTPEAAYPGEEITLEGDYLNLIHEVIFANKVYVSESDFVSHSRYSVKVRVPAEAKTGKVGVGTIDETKVVDEDILAALNVVEIDFTVKTAEGSVSGSYKAGATVNVTGNHLSLTTKVLVGKIEIADPVITDSKISFVLPANVPDGDVILVMASGVEVVAGAITSVVPTGLSAAPAPVKNGAVLTISGNDLDLVTGVDFPNAAGAEFAFADGKVTATVPEKAQEGDITLTQANGKSVTVAYTLVKPTVTGFSANPASAGSDVTIEGTDLDLVAAVTFVGADAVEVESTETAITVAVPTSAETGKLVLNLKNGSSVETIELAVDKPAGAYIAVFPEDLYAPGAVFIVDIENAEHLTGVQIDGADVTYILSDVTLYVSIPDSAKRGSKLTLVSDNGSVTYDMNIDPGDIIETVLFTGPVDNGNWQNYVLPADTFTKVEMKAGQTLRFYVTLKDAWWQMQFFDGHWGKLNVGYGQGENGYNINAGVCDASEGFVPVTLTEEMITILTTYNDWGADCGGGILQGENIILEKITYYEDNSDGTVVWEDGPLEITWSDGGRVTVPVAAFQVAKAGQKLRLFYTQQQDTWGQIQVNNGGWNTIDLSADGLANPIVPTADELYGWFSDGILDRCTEITLTADLLEHIIANAGDFGGVPTGIIIQGEHEIFTKVTIK